MTLVGGRNAPASRTPYCGVNLERRYFFTLPSDREKGCLFSIRQPFLIDQEYCAKNIHPTGKFSGKAFHKNEETRELFLVTGDRGSGKTAWCLELFAMSRATCFEPVGLVSPAVFLSGTKTSVDLMNLSTSERRQLAVRWDSSQDTRQPGDSCINWPFEPAVIAWGNKVLLALQLLKFLILDEIGPLEFLDGKGLNAGTRILDERNYHLACVTVRPELLGKALERWPEANVLDITNRKPIPGEIGS